MDIYRLRRWIFRGSISSIAPAVEFVSRFVRTIILSRLLSTEEFGIAIAITVMLGVAGLVTDVSLDKFALVESEGNDSDALAAAHLLSIVRGILIGAILALGAPFIAASFGVPQTSWSFALAGVVPIFASAAHLGIKTVQRNYEYAPEALTVLFSSVVSISCLAGSIYILGDHRAILVSYFGEAIAYLIASHVLAPGPYRLAAHRTMIIKALLFGAPLVINGIGLALLAQFDRVLVGYWLGVDKLATYAVILNISVAPISLLLRVFGTMSLSYLLSQGNTGGTMGSKRYYSLTFLFAVLAALYSLFVALTLDWATPLVFGKSFHVSSYVHLLITAIVFVRLQRGGAPTSVLLAIGRTRELAALSLSGGAGLVIAAVFLYFSPRFEMVFSGVFIGELISFFLLLAVTSRTIKARGYALLIDVTIGFTVLALIIGLLALFPVPNLMRVVCLLFAGGAAIALQIAVGLRLHPHLLR
jgi:O-antigen/teichoic acid export membrane protein